MNGDENPRPGTRAHFEELARQMMPYWQGDLAYVARTLNLIGPDRATNALNTLRKETRRTTPPTFEEVTAIEITVWDNWSPTGGRKPSERKKEPNYDKARWKAEIELWNIPAPDQIWGRGNRAQNSIYEGTAITLDQAKLARYLSEKREGKRIKDPWTDDLGAWADTLEDWSTQHPDWMIGPLCWTANKKLFVPGLAVLIDKVGKKDMAAIVTVPGGSFEFKRWTSKRANGSVIKGPNGEAALQCRATSRVDQSAWRNAKLN